MIHELGRRKHRDYAAQAALHGVKLKMPPSVTMPQEEPESWIDQNVAERAMKEAQQNVKRRYGR